MPASVVGRLAPTPSGHLHLGNALAFAAAFVSVRQHGGRLLLRIEDVDRGRARDDIAERQREDLRWLGLDWDEEVLPQSARDYTPWLEVLRARTYRCTCTRRQLRERGAEVYDGFCRDAGHTEGAVRFALTPGPVTLHDRHQSPCTVDPATLGDPVLRRRDGVFAYPLAVVADDLADGVTEVVRGADLYAYTAVLDQLFTAFGATPPSILHAPLVLGPDGRKLSKSHGATELRVLRAAGWTQEDVWRLLCSWLGVPGERLVDALQHYRPGHGPKGPVTVP